MRAKMSEALLAASTCRTGITETIQSANSGTIVAAGEWGCEQSVAASGTKYVATILTTGLANPPVNGNAVITVTTQNLANAAAGAAGGTVRMAPCSASTQTTFATCVPPVPGRTVHSWVCGPGAATPVLSKFLPGSCRQAT